jgi:hypothetical protein
VQASGKLFRKGVVELALAKSPLLESLADEKYEVDADTATVLPVHRRHPKRLTWPFSKHDLETFVAREKFAPMIEYYPDNHAQYLELAEARRPIAMAIIDPSSSAHLEYRDMFAQLFAKDAALVKGLTPVWVDAPKTHKRFFMMIGLVKRDLPHFAVIHDGQMASCGKRNRQPEDIAKVLGRIVSKRATMAKMSLPSMKEFEKWEKNRVGSQRYKHTMGSRAVTNASLGGLIGV